MSKRSFLFHTQEEKKRIKEEQEAAKKAERAKKMAEFEKYKNPPQRNFVIQKKEGGIGDEVRSTVPLIFLP